MSAQCWSCGEEDVEPCPKSERECGHHCNHSLEQDECCWCGKEFGEDNPCACGEQITNGSDKCLGCYLKGA